MQLRLNVLTKTQIKNCWVFAASTQKRKTKKSLQESIITSCSREAKVMGITAGMPYEEARMLVPELKVIVYRSRTLASS